MKMLTRDNDSEPRKKNTEQKTTKNKTPDKKKVTNWSGNSNNSDVVIIAHELLHKRISFSTPFSCRLTD